MLVGGEKEVGIILCLCVFSLVWCVVLWWIMDSNFAVVGLPEPTSEDLDGYGKLGIWE